MSERRKITAEDKRRIIEKSLDGISVKDISSMLSLKYSTVWRIVDQFNKTGDANEKKKGGGTRSKLTLDQKNEVLSWVDENCLLRLKDIVNLVQEKFNILTSKSAIDRILRGFHYTVKSIVLVSQRRNDVRTIDIRERYAEKFRRLEAETEHSNLVFIDEVGFCVVSRPKKGRSIVGSSPYVSVSAARSRNISVVAAMNKYGLIYHKIHNTAVNGEDFKTCLIELKNQCLAAGISDPVFILDNARIHHYKG